MCVCLYLSVQPQHDDHEEEADSPELGQRHHGYSSRVGNEGKARTWEETPPQEKYDEQSNYMLFKREMYLIQSKYYLFLFIISIELEVIKKKQSKTKYNQNMSINLYIFPAKLAYKWFSVFGKIKKKDKAGVIRYFLTINKSHKKTKTNYTFDSWYLPILYHVCGPFIPTEGTNLYFLKRTSHFLQQLGTVFF